MKKKIKKGKSKVQGELRNLRNKNAQNGFGVGICGIQTGLLWQRKEKKH